MSVGARVSGASGVAGRGLAQRDVGLLLFRGVIGLLFIGHGTGKLFGWFGQGGLDGTSRFFQMAGYTPGRPFAILAGLAETGAGVLLVLGLFTSLAAAAVIGDMLNAAWVKSAAGFWTAMGGFEYELVLIVLMLTLAIGGPGAYSLDHGRPWSRSSVRLAVAVVLGFGSGLIMMAVRS